MLLHGLNTNAFRKKGLAGLFIHDARLVTDDYVDSVTRFQKVENTMEVGLTIARKQFFDKLGDEIHRLGGMDVPSLIVWGREDEAIPLCRGQEMHRILRGSRLEILDDAGHVPNFERAREFNQLAVDFLRE